jgi:hypothetical protein
MRALRGVAFSMAMAISSTAYASESFVLNVPVRGDAQQEIGMVRIVLGLGAAPNGAQLIVNGTTTLNPGDTQTVGGDSVSFQAGSNAVTIVYQPLSNFTGNSFCNGGAAVARNVPMRFAGPQDVTYYAMSSFVVASPAFECSQPSRRIADTPATIDLTGDGVAPPLSATNRGRLPLDVVLVLDKSGSMADLPPGANAGATKIEILKSAVDAFVGSWEAIDAPTPEGGDWSQDRIGLVFFDSAAAAQTLQGADPPGNVFVQRGSTTPAPWSAVINDVDTLTPGSSTSIGAGINEGMKQWKIDPAHDLTVVLVTDGMQNTAPLIAPAPSGLLGLVPVSGLAQELAKRFIPIETIAFGTPATVDEQLLQDISLETAGRSYMGVNAASMFDVFANTLVSVLKGNTASLVVRRSATLSGPGPTQPLPVPIDGSARRVVFSLQWAPPMSGALDLEVTPPNAAAPSSSQKLPQASIQAFDVAKGGAGTWNVRVKRAGRLRDSRSPVAYVLNVFVLERDLDFRLSVDPPRARTGDAITLRAAVSWDGKPLTGLPPGALRVRVQRPPEALGTILHETKGGRGSGTTNSPAGDAVTPYARKVARLSTSAFLARVTPRDVESIELTEQGRGVYTAKFDGTTIPGPYGFEFVLDWNHVRRVERVEHLVRFAPDAKKTIIARTPGAGDKLLVSVTPRDKSGNYLGPGFAPRVTLHLRSGRPSPQPVDRDQTGTYVFTIDRAEALDAEVRVDGVVVGKV